jgi:hypothetical protein
MSRERVNRLAIDRLGVLSLLGFLALAGWACRTVQPKGARPSPLMAASGAVKSSAADIRTMCNVLAVSVPGLIEAAADRAGSQASDAVTKRGVLLWKIEVIPAFYQAFFYPDPLAAVIDGWALSVQLEAAAGSTVWKDRLGSVQPAALEAAHRIRVQIEDAVRPMAKTAEDFDREKAKMERWAREHPIEGPISSRPSVLPELTRMAVGGMNTSAFQAMADIPAGLDDLAIRLDIYAAYLPKSIRWQAELMAGDFADQDEAQRMLATLASVETLTERMNELLSPEGIRGTLDTVGGQIHAELSAALDSIGKQRVETLAYLTRERTALAAEVERERDAFLRQADDLRRKALSDLDGLAARIIRQAARTVALLIVLTAALTLAVIYLASRLRAKRSATS